MRGARREDKGGGGRRGAARDRHPPRSQTSETVSPLLRMPVRHPVGARAGRYTGKRGHSCVAMGRFPLKVSLLASQTPEIKPNFRTPKTLALRHSHTPSTRSPLCCALEQSLRANYVCNLRRGFPPGPPDPAREAHRGCERPAQRAQARCRGQDGGPRARGHPDGIVFVA